MKTFNHYMIEANSEYGLELEKLGKVNEYGPIRKTESKFKVIQGYNGKPFDLTIGKTPGTNKYEKIDLRPGEIITYDSEGADDVYFTYQGKRGYISSGDIWNLRKNKLERIS